MPANLQLMSAPGGPFRPAGSCPVASQWARGEYMPHQGDDAAFLVADARTRDSTAAARIALWRCVHCGTLLAGITRAEGDPDGLQQYTWLEEEITLVRGAGGQEE